MADRWVVLLEHRKVMEDQAGPVLAFLQKLDPFVVELQDGMEVEGHLVSRAVEPVIQRSEEEKTLWWFTSSLHSQIHRAADAANRGQVNQAMSLLFLVRDRVNHFLINKKDPNHRGI